MTKLNKYEVLVTGAKLKGTIYRHLEVHAETEADAFGLALQAVDEGFVMFHPNYDIHHTEVDDPVLIPPDDENGDRQVLNLETWKAFSRKQGFEFEGEYGIDESNNPTTKEWEVEIGCKEELYSRAYLTIEAASKMEAYRIAEEMTQQAQDNNNAFRDLGVDWKDADNNIVECFVYPEDGGENE